jgi:HJR/Mrr/RecB family endonuclease
MSPFKFNGVLQKIFEQYPNIDLVEFLQEELRFPQDKAQDLAYRIEKKYRPHQTLIDRSIEKLFVKAEKSELQPKTTVYAFDCLSEKEFASLIKWVLKEIGYKIQTEIIGTPVGICLIAAKVGEKIAIHILRIPKTRLISNPTIALVDELKHEYNCDKSLIVASTEFTQQAIALAQDFSVELWNPSKIEQKINEAQKNACLQDSSCFPSFQGSLLQSLLCLEDTRNFIIAPRTDQKYDIYLPGVKYPLLTFHVQSGVVVWCVYRIQSNEPVGELDAQVLVSIGPDGARLGPDDVEAYCLITQYLEQFLK